ncbi:succinate dehydrogenase cytochrome b subunit [Chlorobium sp. N1]|uniref:succinate dehydrogenase cytochrome b subunit n=1 Tax=Chlorobium sp. N1 TaxID=2491138 RepID=UPI00103F14D5|nr:succinate dehydrogenase cytochrome b subunit [Chlorobium sp. N1]TCD48151.1 succinate dehydrogenase cytochrome b subunit [Chlorobium sp. N1]
MPLNTSIARKLLMALAGLFLALFLPVHLGLNLLLLKGDGGESFTAAAEFMATNPFIRIAEPALFLGFLLHILYGFMVSGMNRAARPVGYERPNASQTSPLSKYMFQTGLVVLVFLAMHLADFWFLKVGILAPPEGIARHDFYHRALLLFSSPVSALFYVGCFLFLGFHLNHALQSAFQTIGLNHSRYTPAVKLLGSAYAVLMTAGFSLIPLRLAFFP